MNDLQTTQPQAGFLSVNSSREMSEVRAAIFLAREFPRDLALVEKKLLAACSRYSLAEQAMYAYPRGKEIITGPSIRLAEAILQAYGNASSGIRELRQDAGESIIQAYAWDCESNVRSEKIFAVPHKRTTKKGTTTLTDSRDIYELVANMGSRRLRACILALIPGDLVDMCVEQCEKTLAKGSGDTLAKRIEKMLAAFGELGVSKEKIEGRLKHKIEATNETELVNLAKIFKSIRDGMAKPADFFDVAEAPKAEDLNEKFAAPAPVEESPAPAKTQADLKVGLMKQFTKLTNAGHKLSEIWAFLGYPDGVPNIANMLPTELVELISSLDEFPPEAP